MKCSKWVFQERRTDSPWALYLTYTRKRAKCKIECAIYADWYSSANQRHICNPVSYGGKATDRGEALHNVLLEVELECRRHGAELTLEDRLQIHDELDALCV